MVRNSPAAMSSEARKLLAAGDPADFKSGDETEIGEMWAATLEAYLPEVERQLPNWV